MLHFHLHHRLLLAFLTSEHFRDVTKESTFAWKKETTFKREINSQGNENLRAVSLGGVAIVGK